MKKSSSWLTPSGVALALITLAAMGLWAWTQGSLVFSPGPLSAVQRTGVTLGGFTSHADFETQCNLCHQPLRSTQAPLCLKCHTDIQDQIVNENGLHARLKQVDRCAACHSDHRGRDFDPTQSALANFDHSLTRFSLLHHQIDYDATPMACSDCHTRTDFVVPSDACAACHAQADNVFMVQHVTDFGQDCLACHDGLDSMARFDHNSTGFLLEGQHATTRCASCHVNGVFQGTARECVACHQEPEMHRGLFDLQCETCHSPQAWSPAQLNGAWFDHQNQAGFSLARHAVDYQDQPITCTTCHRNDLQTFDQAVCADCHSAADPIFMQDHQAQFGPNCTSCHDGVDRMRNFDHADVFPLDGAHAGLECTACHENQMFAGTPSECWQCHAEPEIHAGFFGLQCQNCHQTDAWAPARMRVHTFPLDHGNQGEVSCEVCHPNRYTEYTCYGCHEHQADAIAQSHTRAGIALADLPDCIACHADGAVQEQP